MLARIELHVTAAVHGVVLKGSHNRFPGRLRRVDVPDPRLSVPFKLSQSFLRRWCWFLSLPRALYGIDRSGSHGLFVHGEQLTPNKP